MSGMVSGNGCTGGVRQGPERDDCTKRVVNPEGMVSDYGRELTAGGIVDLTTVERFGLWIRRMRICGIGAPCVGVSCSLDAARDGCQLPCAGSSVLLRSISA